MDMTESAGYTTSYELDVRIGGLLNAFRLGMEDGLVELIEQDPGSIAVTIGGTVLLSSSTIGRIILAVMAVVFTGLVLVEMTLTTASLQNMYVKAREYGKEAFMLLLCAVTLAQVGSAAVSEAEQAAKALSRLKDYDFINRVLKSNWKEMLAEEGGYIDPSAFTLKAKRFDAKTIAELLKNTDDILSKEAAAYMAEEYKSATELGKVRSILTQAEEAANAKGTVLNLQDMKYLIRSIGDGVSPKKRNSVIQFFSKDTAPATVNGETFGYLKSFYEGENSNVSLEKIVNVVNTASEAKGEAVVLEEAEYIVRASRKRISQKKITEVVADGIPVSVRSMIEAIPKEYKKMGTCDDFAEALQAELNKIGLENELYKVENLDGIYIYSNKYKRDIGNNGYHYGIKVGDVVYDNLYLTGISFQEWEHDLGLDLGLKNLKLRKVKKVDRKAPK